MPALADDSGLEIDFHWETESIPPDGEETDQERIKKFLILFKIQKVSKERLVLYKYELALPGQGNYKTKGICSGRITLTPKGAEGFGYDPIFIPDGYDQIVEWKEWLKQDKSSRCCSEK